MEQDVSNIICRCEEISEQEIRDAIREFNLRTVDEVKRLTRARMGLCQGRTCESLIIRIIAEETNKRVGEIFPSGRRPPIRPTNIRSLAKEGQGEVE